MAISFGAIGTKPLTETTQVTMPYPAGVATGDLAVAGLVGWLIAAVTFSTVSGWTLEGNLEGGTGGSSDNHSTEVGAHTRILDGTESGSVVFPCGTAGGSIGQMLRYTCGAGETFNTTIDAVSGTDDTQGADRAVTATANLTFAPGDMVVAIAAINTDAALTISANTITASGITFGTTTRRTSGAGSASGVDGNIEVFDALVSSGSGTTAPSLAFTTATSQCGPVLFLKVRVDVAAAATQPIIVMPPRRP